MALTRRKILTPNKLFDAIEYFETIKDYVSRDLLTKILESEEEHIDFLETQLSLIEKIGEKNSQKAIYKKTVIFNTVSFEKKVNGISQKSSQKNVKSEHLLPLEAHLKAYQVDMMASIGESEEYIRLFEQFPELKEQLSEKYHLARDQSSKLLGQIKAIKTVLSLRETKCA